jgi:hypothetical protein
MERSKQNDVQRDWDVVSRWMLPGLVVLVLLTGIDTLTYHLRERDRRMQALHEMLPRNYEQTIRALVAASGHSCEQLCGLTPLETISDRMSVVASCGVKAPSGGCTPKARFTLTVTPAAVPSR